MLGVGFYFLFYSHKNLTFLRSSESGKVRHAQSSRAVRLVVEQSPPTRARRSFS